MSDKSVGNIKKKAVPDDNTISCCLSSACSCFSPGAVVNVVVVIVEVVVFVVITEVDVIKSFLVLSSHVAIRFGINSATKSSLGKLNFCGIRSHVQDSF